MALPQLNGWQGMILDGIGAPRTSENLRFLDAWQRSEGGDYANNPFNTTLQTMHQIGGSNSAGVRGYDSPEAGIQATVQTLLNSGGGKYYSGIISALRRGDSAMQAANALAASPWGTGALVQKVLGGATGFQTVTGGVDTQGMMTTDGTDAGSSTPTDPASASQPQDDFMAFAQKIMGSHPSPTATRLMGGIGDLTKQVLDDSDTSFFDEPVVKTLWQLPTGSSDPKKQTIDLGVDFDGPINAMAMPVIEAAKKFLGTPYVWGGADPRKGFDCSGLVQYLFKQEGIAIPRVTTQQVKVGQPIQDPSQLHGGDLVFFDTEGTGQATHVGIYIGGGQFIHAPHTGDVVKISSLSSSYYQQHYLTGRRITAQ